MEDINKNNLSKTWVKSIGQSQKIFQEQISEYVDTWEEKGYRVDLEWITDEGNKCSTKEEIDSSIKCITRAKKIETDLRSDSTDPEYHLFTAQIMKKSDNESHLQFKENVADYVVAREKAGFILKVKWLKDDGELCKTEEEKMKSTMCKILEKEKTLEERVKDQRALLDNIINNSGTYT